MARPAWGWRSQSRRLSRTCWLSCCACLALCLLLQVVTAEPSALISSPTGALSSAGHTPPLALAGARAADARKKGDYDDYDYGEDDDDDDDYDYYGTKQKKKKKKKPAAAPQPIVLNETSMFKFVSALLVRFVWGLASVFGFDEQLADAFGGAFVPPGVDVDDDGGLGFDY